MVNIKIFGGEREIGGNKILLEFKNTRLMLDFGLSFSQEKKYFSEF
jgi:ribonuclease J